MKQISYSELITPDFQFIIDTNNHLKKYRVIIQESFPVRLDNGQISFHDDIPDMYVHAKVIVEFGFLLLKIWKTYDVIFKIEHGKVQYGFLGNQRQKPFTKDFYFTLKYDIHKIENSEECDRILYNFQNNNTSQVLWLSESEAIAKQNIYI